ncbi:MAG TPA: glycerol-3-phosphate dehydrogenase subunit GlpB [Anaerolineae bacterium]|nr:glycerol-3-phosphate dehydrogenase subunit GlpB [Anaerolineae bacterium]HOR00041.1 glycerol-3-phosphate dehydrogenase subunit GlpB [Anaerolineae bacterium]HPL27425.1 glycerol-3-phosphate dehydrogenase subunit GlpB [Anaerolineae bacterium]
MFDLTVIGAGLAGMLAACNAAKAGLKVKVIAQGLGALHWSAGTVDVLGYDPATGTPVSHPLQAIEALSAAQPAHPYALAGTQALAAALDEFQALAAEAGLPYAGAATAGENLWLPSPLGAARPALLAPKAQLAGALAGAPLLIVGLQGMRDFFPELIAENLRRAGHQARAASLPLELVTTRRDSNNVHLALALDDPARHAALGDALAALLQPGERIGLPAIVGLKEHAAALAELRARLGVPVFEVPTLPPSVPGLRLNAALRGHLQRLGVRLELNAEVTGLHAAGGRLTAVETATSSTRPRRHEAHSFLLATGGLLGRGIDSDHAGRVWETALNLPLAALPERTAWFRPGFLDPAGHPLFRSGVAVDRHFQPVDEAGAPVYANLWAAGGILAHADPVQERSLEGIAIATGIAAAREIVATRRPDEEVTS